MSSRPSTTGDTYRIVSFPRSRLATVDVGRYGAKRHSMLGLVEVDVTDGRHALRRLRLQGVEVSFTAWVIKCIGDCVARNPEAHAMRLGRRRLVLFEGVDVALPVERRIEGKDVPLPLLIRSVDSKSMAQIDREIKEALRHSISTERDFILSEHGFGQGAMKLYYSLPAFIRVGIWKGIFGNPFRAKKHSGTVMVTTVNAAGPFSAWIVPTRAMHGLSFAIGTVTKKAWIHEGTVQPREIMNLTVSLDHDVIDGAPARRFIQDLVTDLERGDVGSECPAASPP